jgi:hypothetical protein
MRSAGQRLTGLVDRRYAVSESCMMALAWRRHCSPRPSSLLHGPAFRAGLGLARVKAFVRDAGGHRRNPQHFRVRSDGDDPPSSGRTDHAPRRHGSRAWTPSPSMSPSRSLTPGETAAAPPGSSIRTVAIMGPPPGKLVEKIERRGAFFSRFWHPAGPTMWGIGRSTRVTQRRRAIGQPDASAPAG